ncbi:MAG: hypothetical protein AAB558_01895 [Patescibacteria group bacterium]
MNKKLISLSAVIAASTMVLGALCTQTTTTNTNTATTTTNTTVPVVLNETAADAAILADTNGQWAVKATASTEYGSDSWAAKQATGQPNVTAYADNASAWAPLERNKGTETLELTYANPVYAIGVRIHETYGAGALTKIELKGTNGIYYPIWEGTDTTRTIGYGQAAVAQTSYLTKTVRLTFDTTLSPEGEWAEVDAVQLVGVN